MRQHHVPPEWREALVHVQQAEDRLATLTADITKLETEKAERERAFKLWEADLVARSQAATTEAERVHAAAAEKIAEANAAEGRLKGARDELAALFANVKR
jgi:hypothetical protein